MAEIHHKLAISTCDLFKHKLGISILILSTCIGKALDKKGSTAQLILAYLFIVTAEAEVSSAGSAAGGIIAGAVIVLVLVILVILFILYR